MMFKVHIASQHVMQLAIQQVSSEHTPFLQLFCDNVAHLKQSGRNRIRARLAGVQGNEYFALAPITPFGVFSVGTLLAMWHSLWVAGVDQKMSPVQLWVPHVLQYLAEGFSQFTVQNFMAI
jgi:hypothetical protein